MWRRKAVEQIRTGFLVYSLLYIASNRFLVFIDKILWIFLRPMEISSKKPVSRFREVIQAPKKVELPLLDLICE